jgi:hypothetical protein
MLLLLKKIIRQIDYFVWSGRNCIQEEAGIELLCYIKKHRRMADNKFNCMTLDIEK